MLLINKLGAMVSPQLFASQPVPCRGEAMRCREESGESNNAYQSLSHGLDVNGTSTPCHP